MENTNTTKAVIPPFLFRAATDDTQSSASRGINTKDEIDPLFGTGIAYHDDLTTNPKLFSTARMMVHDHINCNNASPTEFSSWHVSLLFVLQHAVREYDSRDKGDERHELVYVMDTSMLPASRIHYAPDLLKWFKLEKWATCRESKLKSKLKSKSKTKSKPLLTEYAQGEYPIHGRLRNKRGLWKAVSIKQLIAAGLRENFIWLSINQDKEIHEHLIRVRKSYFGPVDNEGILQLQFRFEDFVAIARCFGREFEGVVFLALITCKRKNLLGNEVKALPERLASLMRLPKLPSPSDAERREALRGIHMQWRGMREAHQFMRLLRLLDELEPLPAAPRDDQASTIADKSMVDAPKRKRTLPWLENSGVAEKELVIGKKKRRTLPWLSVAVHDKQTSS